MGTVEKSVFISYRRLNMPWALAIYQDLTTHGYDVFFDYDSIASGDFEQIILGNIRARAHFLVVLTPSALEKCDEPNDWLRREIETALAEKRNIVPIFLEGFDFGSPSIAEHLTGKLANLKKYNGQNVPAGFFDEAMTRVRTKFLNVTLDTVLHPVSKTVREVVQEQQTAASNATDVKENELIAQEWFEKGLDLSEEAEERPGLFDEIIYCTSEAIRLQPNFPRAYLLRAQIRVIKKDFGGVIQDFTEAIHYQPDLDVAYGGRALIYALYFDDLDKAIQDITEAIRLKPDDPTYYSFRGNYWFSKGDYSSSFTDFIMYFDLGGKDEVVMQRLEEAKKKLGQNAVQKLQLAASKATDTIRKKSTAEEWKLTAEEWVKKGADLNDPDEKIRCMTEAIRLQPNNMPHAYFTRSIAFYHKGDIDSAIRDVSKGISILPNDPQYDLGRAEMYGVRGTFFYGKKDYKSAAEDIQKYFDLGGDDDENLRNRLGDSKKKINKKGFLSFLRD
jgi:tetratricopeptide (TPR) repeat protein